MAALRSYDQRPAFVAFRLFVPARRSIGVAPGRIPAAVEYF
jgi:hypothetical protein